jgi:hypothetical protein
LYKFSIKENGPDVIVLVTRSLLALGAIISLLYQKNPHYNINIIVSAMLFAMAVSVNMLPVKLRLNTSLLLWIAAVILFIATRSVPFSIILAAVGLLIKKLNKNPIVEVDKEGVSIKKMFGNHLHSWGEFNNIILKDNLLTLDFKNNRLLQLTINESNFSVDEHGFNIFCSGFIRI